MGTVLLVDPVIADDFEKARDRDLFRSFLDYPILLNTCKFSTVKRGSFKGLSSISKTRPRFRV
jgi:hypothetical protein